MQYSSQALLRRPWCHVLIISSQCTHAQGSHGLCNWEPFFVILRWAKPTKGGNQGWLRGQGGAEAKNKTLFITIWIHRHLEGKHTPEKEPDLSEESYNIEKINPTASCTFRPSLFWQDSSKLAPAPPKLICILSPHSHTSPSPVSSTPTVKQSNTA